MSKWNCCVQVKLEIDYCDIEAETEEEAKQIAEEMAMEDVDYNNAESIDYDCYCVWEEDEDDKTAN